jgi:hypothetical protein
MVLYMLALLNTKKKEPKIAIVVDIDIVEDNWGN